MNQIGPMRGDYKADVRDASWGPGVRELTMTALLNFLVRLTRQGRIMAEPTSWIMSPPCLDRQVMKVRRILREKESGSPCCCLKLGCSCKAQPNPGDLTSCLLLQSHWLVELSWKMLKEYISDFFSWSQLQQGILKRNMLLKNTGNMGMPDSAFGGDQKSRQQKARGKENYPQIRCEAPPHLASQVSERWEERRHSVQ